MLEPNQVSTGGILPDALSFNCTIPFFLAEPAPSPVEGYSLLEYSEHQLAILRHKRLDYEIEYQFLKRIMAATQRDIDIQAKQVADLREKEN